MDTEHLLCCISKIYIDAKTQLDTKVIQATSQKEQEVYKEIKHKLNKLKFGKGGAKRNFYEVHVR